MPFPQDHPVLIEINGAVFDRAQLALSNGYEALDAVGQESFVNHVHLGGTDRTVRANRLVSAWQECMQAFGRGRLFRLYIHRKQGEIIVRFHVVRAGVPNWYEAGDESIEIIEVVTQP